MNETSKENKHHPDWIFLIGYMGCGKTTMGKKLAAKMDYEFVDLDHVFEEQEGTTIARYFAAHGEDAFRKLESAILKQTAYPGKTVISTGGGLPCFFDNMQWMNAHGQTVYIKLNAKTLAGRLEGGKEERPILRDKHGDDLIAFIGEKLTEREPHYNQATIIADGLSLTPEKLEQILETGPL